MIVKSDFILKGPHGTDVTITLSVDAGISWRDQHQALQWLTAASNKLSIQMREDPKWRPLLAF